MSTACVSSMDGYCNYKLLATTSTTNTTTPPQTDCDPFFHFLPFLSFSSPSSSCFSCSSSSSSSLLLLPLLLLLLPPPPHLPSSSSSSSIAQPHLHTGYGNCTVQHSPQSAAPHDAQHFARDERLRHSRRWGLQHDI
eukprot:gene3298-5988_t